MWTKPANLMLIRSGQAQEAKQCLIPCTRDFHERAREMSLEKEGCWLPRDRMWGQRTKCGHGAGEGVAKCSNGMSFLNSVTASKKATSCLV